MLRKKIKNNNQKNSKSQFFIIGSILIVFGIIFLGITFYDNWKHTEIEQTLLIDFFEQFESQDFQLSTIETNDEKTSDNENIINSNFSYLAVLKVASINLECGFFSKDSRYNSVNYGIEVLKESSMPNVDGGNTILVSHSGNSRISYFKNLHKLNINDEVSIFYQGHEYVYKVVNNYEVVKNGTVGINRNKQNTTLTLITCVNNDKQLVIICELEKIL